MLTQKFINQTCKQQTNIQGTCQECDGENVINILIFLVTVKNFFGLFVCIGLVSQAGCVGVIVGRYQDHEEDEKASGSRRFGERKVQLSESPNTQKERPA